MSGFKVLGGDPVVTPLAEDGLIRTASDADAITRALEGAAAETARRREDLSSRLAAVTGRVARLEALAKTIEGVDLGALQRRVDEHDGYLEGLRARLPEPEPPIAIDDVVEWSGNRFVVRCVDGDHLWARHLAEGWYQTLTERQCVRVQS